MDHQAKASSSRRWPAMTCRACGKTFRGSLVRFHQHLARHRQTQRAENRGIGFLSCFTCGFTTDQPDSFAQHRCCSATSEDPGADAATVAAADDDDPVERRIRELRLSSPVWSDGNHPGGKEAARQNIARAKGDHEKRRVNQMEVTTMELERIAAISAPSWSPTRQLAGFQRSKMRPCKLSPLVTTTPS